MNVDFNIINQKGSPAIFSDVYANRPAASYPGRLFISTDTKEIYRDTGTAWEEIAGSGSGNIQGSGTANYVPKFTDTETIGNSQIRDDGTGVGIGVAPSAVYYLDIGGSQRNTLSGAGGFTLRQSGSTIAAYGVYDSASTNAFLFSKDGTTNSIYSVGKIEHKIFDGSTNYYISEFVTGNFGVNTQTDAGFKLDVNGTAKASAYYLTGMTAGNGALYWTSDRVTLANYNTSGTIVLETNGGVAALTLAANQAATFASTVQANGIFKQFTAVGYYADFAYNGTTYNLGSAEFSDNIDYKIAGGGTFTTGGKFRWFTQAGGGTPVERFSIDSTGAATFSGAVAIGNTVAVSVATPSTHKVTMVIGGTTYYLLATNV